jgi:hypothetical protein
MIGFSAGPATSARHTPRGGVGIEAVGAPQLHSGFVVGLTATLDLSSKFCIYPAGAQRVCSGVVPSAAVRHSLRRSSTCAQGPRL